MANRWDEDDFAALWGEYAQRAERFWAANAQSFCKPTDGVILVELIASVPPSVIANLFIAQYLRMRTGAQIVAIIPHRDSAAGIAAKGFGAKVVEVRELDDEAGQRMSQPWRDATRLVGPELQRFILSLNIDSLPIGDLIYDDLLRFNNMSTVSGPDDRLDKALSKACMVYSHTAEVLSRHRVVAFVTGHRVYSEFGIPPRMAARQSIPTFCPAPPADRLIVRRYDNLAQLQTHQYRMLPSEIAHLPASTRDQLAEEGRQWIERRFRGRTAASEADLYTAFSTSLPNFNRHRLLKELDLDPTRCTAGIMSHVFSDEVHSGSWSVYPDYHVWLTRTLELARALPEINWIVKPHPDNTHYGFPNLEAEMVEACGAKNVRLFPAHANGASLRDAVDALVTVRSEAGLEFATVGIPVVATGEAWYSDWGFAIEPKSEHEYRRALETLPSLGRLAPDQIAAACRFAGLRYSYGLVKSQFMPPNSPAFWIDRDWPQYMRDAMDLFDTSTVEDDPVYRNFMRQLDEGRPHMLDYERLATLGQQASDPEDDGTIALRALRALP